MTIIADISKKIQESQGMDEGKNGDMEKSAPYNSTPKEDESQYPKDMAAVVIMLSVWLSLFIVALVSYPFSTPP